MDWVVARAGASLRIERQPVTFCHVDHVQGDDRGDALRDQFARKAQVIVQIAGIDDNDQRIRTSFTCLNTCYDVARHLLVRAGRFKAVCARQVDEFGRTAIGQDQPPSMAFNCHTRIIAGFLARARQGIEQGRLPGVGIADQGNEQERSHEGDTSSIVSPSSNPSARNRRAAPASRDSQPMWAIVAGLFRGSSSSRTQGQFQ